MNTHNTYLYIYSILSICISIYVHNVEFILIVTPELISTQNPTIVSNSTLACSLPINQHVWSPPIKQHPSGQSDFLDLTTNGKPMENLSHIKSHESHSKSHKSNFWCCCSLFGGENLLMDLDLLGGYHYELGITYYVFVHTYIYIYTVYIYIRQMPGLCPEPQPQHAMRHHHHHHHHHHLSDGHHHHHGGITITIIIIIN